LAAWPHRDSNPEMMVRARTLSASRNEEAVPYYDS